MCAGGVMQPAMLQSHAATSHHLHTGILEAHTPLLCLMLQLLLLLLLLTGLLFQLLLPLPLLLIWC
jgi:hypothetical protein